MNMMATREQGLAMVEHVLDGACAHEWPTVATLLHNPGGDGDAVAAPFISCARIAEMTGFEHGATIGVQARLLLEGMVEDTDMRLRSIRRKNPSAAIGPDPAGEDSRMRGLYENMGRTAIITEAGMWEHDLTGYDGGFTIRAIARGLKTGSASAQRIAREAMLSLPTLERMLAATPDGTIPEPEEIMDREGTILMLSPLIALAEHMGSDPAMAAQRIRAALSLQGGWVPGLEAGIGDGSTPRTAARYPSRVYDTTLWVADIVECSHRTHTPVLTELASSPHRRRILVTIICDILRNIAARRPMPTSRDAVVSMIAEHCRQGRILRPEYAGEAYLLDRILTMADGEDARTLASMASYMGDRKAEGLTVMLEEADRYGSSFAKENLLHRISQEQNQ